MDPQDRPVLPGGKTGPLKWRARNTELLPSIGRQQRELLRLSPVSAALMPGPCVPWRCATSPNSAAAPIGRCWACRGPRPTTGQDPISIHRPLSPVDLDGDGGETQHPLHHTPFVQIRSNVLRNSFSFNGRARCRARRVLPIHQS